MAQSSGSSWLSLLAIGGGLLCICIFACLVAVPFGARNGVEFSPDTFESRTFSFMEIPFFETQVTSITHEDVTGNVASHLRTAGLIKVGKPSRWDLTSSNASSYGRAAYDAHLLVDSLDARNAEGDNVWLIWSQDHPKLAAILWVEVQSLAKENLYVAIPDLLRVAEQSETVDQLQQNIDQVLAEKFRELGQWQASLGNHRQAAELFQRAIDRGDASKATEKLLRESAGPEAPLES
ncbi:MAG: hypothetical protein NXI22_09710 [bacterium]|nr:hypothetical protein [bacterium]